MENLPQDLLRLFVTQKPLLLLQEAFSSFAGRLDASGVQQGYASSLRVLRFVQSLDELMREFPVGVLLVWVPAARKTPSRFDFRLALPTVPQFRYVQNNLMCALPL